MMAKSVKDSLKQNEKTLEGCVTTSGESLEVLEKVRDCFRGLGKINREKALLGERKKGLFRAIVRIERLFNIGQS